MMKKDMTLDELQSYFETVFQERGFDNQTTKDKILLLVEEVGELAKAIRKYEKIGIDYTRIENYNSIESEVADVMIVMISLCNLLDINIFDAIKEKEKINRGRVWK